jgi:hypothetical protein
VGYGSFTMKRGAPRREKIGAASLGDGLGEWESHHEVALGRGKVTHFFLERGAWLRG